MKRSLLDTVDYKLNLLDFGESGPIVLYVTSMDFNEDTEELCRSVQAECVSPFSFCELQVRNWDAMLTPWPADAKMKSRVFQGNAKELLATIQGIIIPKLRETVGESAPIYIVGYSLAGLFALWSTYECTEFAGAVSCSGSLWYPGWSDYAKGQAMTRPVRIYLSLGNAEKNSRHPLMKQVEEHTREQYERFHTDAYVQEVCLEMNEGGHFQEPAKRVAKGIRWILSVDRMTPAD